MVLNSLLQEQSDGSFSWSTNRIGVRVYQETVNSLSGNGHLINLGWTGFVWNANSNPWVDNYLFRVAGRDSKGEAALDVEKFLRKNMPEELPEEPLSALSRIFWDEDPLA